MSLKISFYSQLLSSKNVGITNGYYGRCLPYIVSQLSSQTAKVARNTGDSFCFPRPYSTDPKPHNVTRSLQKWKKKKRKSKAQQKRELENLQQDLFKVLSKRVVKLVQDKTLLSTHRDVVTTYSFTHRLRREDEDSLFPFKNPEHVGAKFKIEDRSGNLEAKQITKHSLPLSISDMVSYDSNGESQNFSHQGQPWDLLATDQTSYKPESYAVKNFLERRRSLGDVSFDSRAQPLSHILESLELSDVFLSVRQEKTMKPTLTTDDVAFTPVDIKPQTIFQSSSSLTEDSKTHKSTGALLNDTFVQAVGKLTEQLNDGEKHKYFWEEKSELSPAMSGHHTSFADFSTDPAAKTTKSANMDPPKKSRADSSTETPLLHSMAGSVISDVKESDRGVKKSAARTTKQINPKFRELCDLSYVEACCFSGCEKLAVRYLKLQVSSGQSPSVTVFNKVMSALAKEHNIDAIKYVFSLLMQGNLTPSLQTYAGCLECLGRMNDPDLLLCEKILVEIEDSELDLGDIAKSCSFEGDEWDHVLKGIHLIQPDFVPLSSSVQHDFSLPLLQALNTVNPERLENNQYALEMTKEEVTERLSHQMDMEKSSQVEIPSIAKSSEKEQEKLKMLVEKQLVLKTKWKETLVEVFAQNLQILEKKAEKNLRRTLYPYLKLFPPQVYADIMIQHLEELFFMYDEMFSPTQNIIQLNVGRAVNRKYNMSSKVSAQVDEKMLKIYDRYLDQFLDPNLKPDSHRLMWTRAMGERFDTINLDTSVKKWPRVVIKAVGKFLLDIVIQNLKVNANEFRPLEAEKQVPAFCTIFRPDILTYSAAELKFHPVVSRIFGSPFRASFFFEPSVVPMLVPPVPWISKTMGGLLLGSNPLIRMSDENSHIDPLENVKETQYSAVLDSLNALGACAWKMNEKMLDLQIKIFNSGGDAKLKVSPPSTEAPPMPVISSDMTGAQRAILYRERLHMMQQKNDMHSLWCTDLYRLSIANVFRKKIFWSPHSLDFRGRTYPLPPHFNHLGSDNVRSLLLFAKGKPLGEDGHDWLKIHLINLTGLKKRCPNAERLEFANSLMDEILDSADNPLTGNKWWQKSDEPWQTLACCVELANIERFEGNKEDYICHFPVHQDGSCNGLQHYAALGRDQSGAESVNLAPCERPQDVYSDVVALVERERKKDAQEGKEIAQILDGFVKRKVIKQTIMTTVYGVTKFGAKLQIFKQLKDLPDLPAESAWNSSIYLTDKTLSCLTEMFTATKDIQDWLTNVAKLISSFKAVDWVTPLGFPVIQPYYKKIAGVAHGSLVSSKPAIMKQKNAFPPNYIHSLDSTHMMLTSLYCMHAGITFVSVHDCFWTHACDVKLMNKICREQFVNMHKQPLLEDLSAHLSDLVKHGIPASVLEDPKHTRKVEEILVLLQCIPLRGDFNLDGVLKSTYFFS